MKEISRRSVSQQLNFPHKNTPIQNHNFSAKQVLGQQIFNYKIKLNYKSDYLEAKHPLLNPPNHPLLNKIPLHMNQPNPPHHPQTPQKIKQHPVPISPTFESTMLKVRLDDSHNFPTVYKPQPHHSQFYRGVVSLVGTNHQTVKFRVFKDCDLGIRPRFQDFIHQSHNDDDRQTTPTQQERAVKHCINDLLEGIRVNNGLQPMEPSTQCCSSSACSSGSSGQSQEGNDIRWFSQQHQ